MPRTRKCNAPSRTGDEAGLSKEAAWERFATMLRDQCDRVTHTRRIVFDHVFARHDHFRADELAAELAEGPERVSRGTVYRTLALLEAAGFVSTINDGATHRHYEHTFGHPSHDHLICERCGAFCEFEDPAIRDLVEANCRRHGFTPRRHRVVVFGLCRDCRG